MMTTLSFYLGPLGRDRFFIFKKVDTKKIFWFDQIFSYESLKVLELAGPDLYDLHKLGPQDEF